MPNCHKDSISQDVAQPVSGWENISLKGHTPTLTMQRPPLSIHKILLQSKMVRNNDSLKNIKNIDLRLAVAVQSQIIEYKIYVVPCFHPKTEVSESVTQ